MPIYALGDQVPDIHPDAYVHPDAVVIGSVTIGARELDLAGRGAARRRRRDPHRARTSIQDNCVLHTTIEQPTVVGDDCVIGHIVHLEGCTIESSCLIGNGSIVLHRVVVHTGAIVAANAVVLDDTDVPSGALAVGIPAVDQGGPGQAGADQPRRARRTSAGPSASATQLRRID